VTAGGRPLGTWRNRILGSGEEAPDQLAANPRNWRTHPAAQRKALRGALDTVGWVQQVIVNRRTGNVVDGHARIEEALSRNEPAVPVLYVDLSDEEEALVLATLDPIAAMAQADDEKLRALLAEVAVDDDGLAALLADLAGGEPKAGLTDPDDVPEPAAEPWVKPGDLFALGAHRILCGDSMSQADVDRLLAGATPRLLSTPGPSNFGLAGRVQARPKGRVPNRPRKRPALPPDLLLWYAPRDNARDILVLDGPDGRIVKGAGLGRALRLSRATAYRHRSPKPPSSRSRRTPPRALSEREHDPLRHHGPLLTTAGCCLITFSKQTVGPDP